MDLLLSGNGGAAAGLSIQRQKQIHHAYKNKIKALLLKKFGINNKYFLVVGNVDHRKQPHKIINAFNQLLKKNPNILLVFVGPNKLKIKSNKNIKILNYVHDDSLNFLYNGSIALIFLSLCEGFGLPIVEAMATKIPVICNDIPVFQEVADRSALFVKNEQKLYQAMKKVFENKNLRIKYSNLCYQRSQFFSWDKTAKETIKVYQRVLERKI